MNAPQIKRAESLDPAFWDRLGPLESRHRRAQSSHENARRELERLTPQELEELHEAWRRYCEVIAELDEASAEIESLHHVPGPTPGLGTIRTLSRRALEQLSALQAAVRSLSVPRNAALRVFMASRHAAAAMAHHEFWLEFSWLDQEYRVAVRRLAQFCVAHAHSRMDVARAPLIESDLQ